MCQANSSLSTNSTGRQTSAAASSPARGSPCAPGAWNTMLSDASFSRYRIVCTSSRSSSGQCRPVSSRISRRAASYGVSSNSTKPPGSTYLPLRGSMPRRASRTCPSRRTATQTLPCGSFQYSWPLPQTNSVASRWVRGDAHSVQYRNFIPASFPDVVSERALPTRQDGVGPAVVRSFGDEPVEPIQEVFEGLFELGGGVVFRQSTLEPADVREVRDIEGLVGVGDVGLALVEGLLGGPDLRAEQGGFQQEVAEQEAGEGPVGLDGPCVVESSRD